MRRARNLLLQLGRTALLIVLALGSTMALARYAPGYLSEAGEMDAKYGASARARLQAESGSFMVILGDSARAWTRGDLGRSRQYEVPVTELVVPRLRVTALLLLRSLAGGWLLALAAALPLSAARGHARLLGTPFTLLLAVPAAALATVCLLGDFGGPVLVLSLLLAARDFKFVERLLRQVWTAPFILQARGAGVRWRHLLSRHVLPSILPQLLALVTLSVVTALSALVPVEVLFDVPGMGRLAWNAALNRDLPVLLPVTAVMAAAMALAGLIARPAAELETA